MFFNFKKPKLKDICPDTAAWKVYKKDKHSIMWLTDLQCPCLLRMYAPGGWNFDLSSPEKARDFYEKQCTENKGAIVEFGVENIKGVETLSGIFKYHSPEEGSMGKMYIGIFFFAFESVFYQVNFEALEVGTTGIRENIVSITTEKMDEQKLKELAENAIPFTSFEDMRKRAKAAKIVRTKSDDREYDEISPDHPLTKVRALMDRFRETAHVAPKLLKTAPYRI